MTAVKVEKKKNTRLKTAWEQTKLSGQFMWSEKMQPVSIATAILMGTTALYTPVLASTIGAGLLTVASLYLLTKTSDVVINNVSALGKKFAIPTLMLGIGLGIVTSLPELAVSVSSIVKNMAEIGIGNIIGSNIANILLVLGVTAAIKPITTKGMSWKFNTAAMLGATVLFGGQMAMGALNPLMGTMMLGALGAYMWGSYKISKKDQLEENKTKDNNSRTEEDDENEAEKKMPAWFNIGWGLAGVAGLVASADILVAGASSLAGSMGVSTALIGALGVAVGTSLPELVVSVKAAVKGETDMAVGNILGSNIFNIMMVGGVLALAGTTIPLAFGMGSALGLLNIGSFVGAAALTAATLFATKGKIKRWHGAAALGLYAAFTAGSIGLENSATDVVHEEQEPIEIQQKILEPTKITERLSSSPHISSTTFLS